MGSDPWARLPRGYRLRCFAEAVFVRVFGGVFGGSGEGLGEGFGESFGAGKGEGFGQGLGVPTPPPASSQILGFRARLPDLEGGGWATRQDREGLSQDVKNFRA